MTAILSIWTPERVEQLKRGFDAGLSCRQIAVEIGVSRNAVIGKLSRLNLTREPRDDAARPRKASPRSPRARTVKHQIRMLQAEYGEAPLADELSIENGHCCSLLELDEQRCRWPVETPDTTDFRFCGNRPVDGLPYCAGHARLAYQPSSRPRAARG
ncbi:GcrA family cell cycle regulator [Bradyrhizobium cenepequi]